MLELSKKIRKPSIIDVAALAGVSKSTVSLVVTNSDKVSKSTKEKVRKSIDELGYIYNRGAASLKGKSSKLIAIFVNDITDPSIIKLVTRLEHEIIRMGFMPIQINTHESCIKQEKSFNLLNEYNIAGYFIFPVENTPADWNNNIVNLGLPVMNIIKELPSCDVINAITTFKKQTQS